MAIKSGDLPSSQHLNEVLLRRTRLIAPFQSTEDTVLLEKSAASRAFDLKDLGCFNVWFWRNHVEIEVFSEDDDTGAIL